MSKAHAVFRLAVTSLTLFAGCKCGDGTRAIGAAPSDASAPAPSATFTLVRNGQEIGLDASARAKLASVVDRAIASCNFRSNAPEHRVAFGGSDPQKTWKDRESGSHLRVRYAAARTFDTIGGPVTADELLLAVDTTYGPEPALARNGNHTIALVKCGYSDRFLGCAPELERAFGKPKDCPPNFP